MLTQDLNESTNLWWIKLYHKQLDAPDRTYQSTQRKKSLRLGALVKCRPKTLGRENQQMERREEWEEKNCWRIGGGLAC